MVDVVSSYCHGSLPRDKYPLYPFIRHRRIVLRDNVTQSSCAACLARNAPRVAGILQRL